MIQLISPSTETQPMQIIPIRAKQTRLTWFRYPSPLSLLSSPLASHSASPLFTLIRLIKKENKKIISKISRKLNNKCFSTLVRLFNVNNNSSDIFYVSIYLERRSTHQIWIFICEFIIYCSIKLVSASSNGH